MVGDGRVDGSASDVDESASEVCGTDRCIDDDGERVNNENDGRVAEDEEEEEDDCVEAEDDEEDEAEDDEEDDEEDCVDGE